MVYLIFRSTSGERFEMGCLIMLGSIDDQVLDQCKSYVTKRIHEWTPEERWSHYFGESNKCVIFQYKEYKLFTACIKLPHYEPEIFCLVKYDYDTLCGFEDIEKEAHNKYYT